MKIMMTRALSVLALATCIACGPDDSTNATDNNGMVDVAAQRQAWEMCVAETTTYTTFETSVSTATRVAAFESMGEKLWNSDMLTAKDFEDSNLLYVEAEGLDSRLSRREDEHYAPVMQDGEVVACNSAEGIPEANPDRCVGPAQIRPVIIDALTDGAMSMNTAEQAVSASEIEAGLLWFLYVSTFKEIHTCSQKKRDCDSSYAYYSGAQPEEMGIGLAGYLRREVPEAHAAVWDTLLEMRCWRQVDDADTAQNDALRDEIIVRMDKALLFGISRLVSARLTQVAMASDEDKPAEWAWLKVMGPVLDRAAKEKDAAKAKTLSDAFAQETPDGLDTAALVTALEELFPSAT